MGEAVRVSSLVGNYALKVKTVATAGWHRTGKPAVSVVDREVRLDQYAARGHPAGERQRARRAEPAHDVLAIGSGARVVRKYVCERCCGT